MKNVLMFGWEYPPHISGGLGVACHGIANGLAKLSLDIFLVLPKTKQGLPYSDIMTIAGAEPQCSQQEMDEFYANNRIQVGELDTLLMPYVTEDQYLNLYTATLNLVRKSRGELYPSGECFNADYGPDLMAEVIRYAVAAGKFALQTDHDVIHAHDWITVLAGIQAKRFSHKPLVFHVHALETDPVKKARFIVKHGLQAFLDLDAQFNSKG